MEMTLFFKDNLGDLWVEIETADEFRRGFHRQRDFRLMEVLVAAGDESYEPKDSRSQNRSMVRVKDSIDSNRWRRISPTFVSDDAIEEVVDAVWDWLDTSFDFSLLHRVQDETSSDKDQAF